MKKQLLATAIAGLFAVPAVAQVTVTGTLDITPHATTKTFIGHDTVTSVETQKTTRTDNGSGGFATSVLNFTATEDLGGGIKATAFINQAINSTSGLFTARDQFVQLESGAGTLKAGRFSPAIEGYGSYAVAGTTNTAGTSDSSGYDFITGSLGYNHAFTRSTATNNLTDNAASLNGDFDRAAVDNGRKSGVLQYVSPVFSGLKATVEMAKNTADRDASARTGKAEVSQQAMRLDFTQGNLALSVAKGTSKTTREAAAASNLVTTNATATLHGAIVVNQTTNQRIISGTQAVVGREAKSDITWFGANYNFGVARVLVAHGQRDDEVTVTGGTSAKQSDLRVTNIGLQIPVGAVTLTASAYDGKDSRTILANDDVKLTGHQLSARYAFSKRTYAYIVNGENKSALTGGGVGSASGNTKVEGTSIGVVHSF